MNQTAPARRTTAFRDISFLGGVRYPVRAASFTATHPSIWPYCVLPVLINMVAVYLVWRWSGGWTAGLLQQYLHAQTNWFWHAVSWIMHLLAVILRLFLALVAFVTIGNIASVPFNDFLSERVDKLACGWRDTAPFNIRLWVTRMFVTILQEMKRMAIFVLAMSALFLLSFFPPLSPITIPLKALVAAMFFAVDYFSYPLERRGTLRVEEKFGFARAHLPASIGFGLAMTVIAMVPLVQFLFIPLGVVGGTLLHGDLERCLAASRAEGTAALQATS